MYLPDDVVSTYTVDIVLGCVTWCPVLITFSVVEAEMGMKVS